MTRVGLIARCDRGGLANQTWEIWRHIEPERTLLVSLGRAARGAENPGRFDHGDIKTTQGDRIPDDTLRSMAEGVDVLVTVETPYNAAAFDLIRGAGCQSVLVANPELFVNRGADVVVVPTPWSIDTVSESSVSHASTVPAPFGIVDGVAVKTVITGGLVKVIVSCGCSEGKLAPWN